MASRVARTGRFERPENEFVFGVLFLAARVQPCGCMDAPQDRSRGFLFPRLQQVETTAGLPVQMPEDVRVIPRPVRRHQSLLGLASLLTGFLAWWLVARTARLPSFILPSPMDVWLRFLGAVSDGTLFIHAGATLLEILLGLCLGVGLATSLGYLVAKSRALERVLSPYLVASQAVPLVAIAPLLVIWFGPGMFSKVLICAMIVFFPVLVNTIVGIRAVPLSLHDLMHSLEASREQILVKLEIPAALPVFLGGLRIGATLSVIGAVVGELVGSSRGLGFLINVGRGQYDTALVFVAVFVLIALALLLYGAVAWVEARALLWQEWREP